MKFLKDLLIVEVETTGEDTEKDAVIQLAAIVLDKDNLLEKQIFNTYIRTSLLEGTLARHSAMLKIQSEVMHKSPKTYDAVKKFLETIDTGATLASQSLKQVLFLRSLFKKAVIPYPFDTHVFLLWPLEYLFVQRLGLKKIPTIDTLANYFSLRARNPNNALERARMEAEVLRRIIKTL